MSVLANMIHERQDFSARHRAAAVGHAFRSTVDLLLTALLAVAVFAKYDLIVDFVQGILSR